MCLRKFQALSTLAEPGASPDADNCRVFADIRAAQVIFPLDQRKEYVRGKTGTLLGF
jgi:hypothetical protein